jgi:PTH1 family peptidyl-tRNA hydrolase
MEIDDLADYVLAEFTREERQVLEDLLDPMSEAVECWLMEGIEKAMSKHNKSVNSEP